MCFDHSNLEIKGGFNSINFSRLAIEFRIPEAECRNGIYDSECVASAEFESRLLYLTIGTLTNRMRFDQ